MTAASVTIDRDIQALIAAHRPGRALEQPFYTDPRVYELELERVINRNWFLAGHESELAEPNEFKVVDVARESAVIVRGGDGVLRAFANVCRHRGSVVCLDAAGSTHKFVCPYHGWTYDTLGRLIAARDMPDGFDRSAYSLRPVACETVHGLVFICFSESPPLLKNCREEMAEPMRLFDFKHLKVAARRTYPIAANWKLAVENYQECYHCAPAHPEYARMHTLMLDTKKRDRAQSALRERMASCGVPEIHIDRIDTAARPGEIGYGYRRVAMFDGYLTGSRDGKPLAPLLGEITDYDGGASDFTFGAFSFLLAYSDHVVAYVFTPVDLENARCEITWLVRGDAIEGDDYDVDALIWLWDVTTEADRTIILNNYRGVRSRYYEPGPLSNMEQAQRAWLDWLLAELLRPL